MESDGRRTDRRARNALVFRAVNEKLRDLNVQFEGFANESAVFVCECERIDCIDQIDIAVEAFDLVRAAPSRYVVVTGHEVQDAEVVIERHDGYSIVEKAVSQAD